MLAVVGWMSCQRTEPDAADAKRTDATPTPGARRRASETRDERGDAAPPPTPSPAPPPPTAPADVEICGVVVPAPGTEVGPGVRVRCTLPPDGRELAEVGADARSGFFRLTVRGSEIAAPGRMVQVAASAPGGLASRSFDAALDGALAGEPVILVLAPTGLLRALAVDENGRPVPRAQWAVEVHAPGPETVEDGGRDFGVAASATSDDAGVLALPLPASDVVLFARARGGVYGPIARCAVRAGKTTDAGAVVIGGDGVTFELRVRDGQGAPVADASVRTLDTDAMGRAEWRGGILFDLQRHAKTGEDGRVAVRMRAAPTPALIAVGAPGLECVQLALERPAPGTTELEVVLSPAARVRIEGLPPEAEDPALWRIVLHPDDRSDRQFVPVRWFPAGVREALEAAWRAKVEAHRALERELLRLGRPKSELPPPPERTEAPAAWLAHALAKSARIATPGAVTVSAPWAGRFRLRISGPDGVSHERIVEVAAAAETVLRCEPGSRRRVTLDWSHLGERGREVAGLRVRSEPRAAPPRPENPEAPESRLTEAWRSTGGIRSVSSADADRGSITLTVPADRTSLAVALPRSDFAEETILTIPPGADPVVLLPDALFPGATSARDLRVVLTVRGERIELAGVRVEAVPAGDASAPTSPRRRVSGATDSRGATTLRLLPGRWRVGVEGGFGPRAFRDVEIVAGADPADVEVPLGGAPR